MTWMERAACKPAVKAGDASLTDWFPEGKKTGVTGLMRRPSSIRAVAICETCEVSGECYSEALKGDWVGIWGGVLHRHRPKAGAA